MINTCSTTIGGRTLMIAYSPLWDDPRDCWENGEVTKYVPPDNYEVFELRFVGDKSPAKLSELPDQSAQRILDRMREDSLYRFTISRMKVIEQ